MVELRMQFRDQGKEGGYETTGFSDEAVLAKIAGSVQEG